MKYSSVVVVFLLCFFFSIFFHDFTLMQSCRLILLSLPGLELDHFFQNQHSTVSFSRLETTAMMTNGTMKNCRKAEILMMKTRLIDRK